MIQLGFLMFIDRAFLITSSPNQSINNLKTKNRLLIAKSLLTLSYKVKFNNIC